MTGPFGEAGCRLISHCQGWLLDQRALSLRRVSATGDFLSLAAPDPVHQLLDQARFCRRRGRPLNRLWCLRSSPPYEERLCNTGVGYVCLFLPTLKG